MQIKYSKLTKKQRVELIEHFVARATVRAVEEIVGVNKNTSQLFFHLLCEIIFEK